MVFVFPVRTLACVAAVAWCALLAPATARGQTAPDQRAVWLYQSVPWTAGPATVDLGGVAKLTVPAGFVFTGPAGAQAWDELNGTPPQGNLGVFAPAFDPGRGEGPPYYINFKYDPIGYVKDDDSAALGGSGAETILTAIRDATEAANVERRRRGWPALAVEGWRRPPAYALAKHTLTWATDVGGPSGSFVNHDGRLLGRHGVMMVTMVAPADRYAAALPVYQAAAGGVGFVPGEAHGDVRGGDPAARYSLAGLIAGAGTVVAVKAWPALLKVGVAVVGVLLVGAAKAARYLGRRGPPRSSAAAAVPGGTADPGAGPAAEAGATVRVPCPSCGRTNRVQNARLHDDPTCGACGKPLLKPPAAGSAGQ